MDSSNYLSTLTFEVKIIRAKNIKSKIAGDLFVRCYLPAGNNTRVQLNTKEISSKSDLFWDEAFPLECLGSQETLNTLKQGHAVLELRLRSSTPLIGRIGGSKLLGRAEIPLKNVFDSPNMEIETWVWMISGKPSCNKDLNPPKVQASMKVKMPAGIRKIANKDRLRRWDECSCTTSGCHSCLDYDLYAIGCALEGF